MKRFAALILFLFCFVARSAEVTFHLSDFGGAALASKKFQITSLSTPRADGGRTIPTDTRTITTDANGDVTTNLLYGNYRIDLSGSSPRAPTSSFIILVPDTTNAASATELMVTASSVPGSSVGYSTVSSDARFVGKTNSWSYGQTLTNAVFSGSTNAFHFTGGSLGDFLTRDASGNWHAATVTPGAGLTDAVTSINGDTNAAQLLITDESGTDFSISTAGGTNAFSLPIASATKTGKLSASDWTIFNAKQAALGYTPLNVASNLSDVANAALARSNIGAGTGNGSVTSIGLTGDSDFQFGPAITTSGTIAISNTNTVGSGPYVRQTNSTLVTPTIASFANANHNHQDSAGGGLLVEAAVSGLTTDLASKISNSLGTGTNATLKGTTLSGSTTNSGVGATKVVVTDSAGVETGATLSGLSLSGTTLSTTENGTVTSVAQTVPSQFQVTGSAITSSGTLAITITNSTGTSTSPLVLQSNATVAGVTLAGSTTNSSLTASRPMKTDANKVQSSGQIDLSTANDVTGVLLAAGFPALTGDITTSAGALATTLKNTGTAGTYAGVTFDAQGRETSAVAYPAAVFVGNALNFQISTTGRSVPFGASAVPSATFSATVERQSSVPIFRSGTLSNLTFRVDDKNTGNAFLGAGTNTTLILYTNAVASPFAFTLDGTTTTTNSGTSSITIPSNTLVSWRITNQVTVSIDLSWSCEFY